MLIHKPSDIRPSEITPRVVYENRRRLMQAAGAGAALASLPPLSGAAHAQRAGAARFADLRKSPFSTGEPLTAYKDATTYINFYEFGTDKSSPVERSKSLRTRPWNVVVEGEVRRPRTFGIEELLKLAPMEERIYRLRCVEAWSMVIPWIGFPLADVIKAAKPRSKAKFVAFTTLQNPEQMPGQKRPILDWPYREGLRLDEAMHPLTILAVGLYGEVLPNQNGAPLRLVVPWKYGFKSIKSIVRITFTTAQPVTSWNMMAPEEYGFYSNVNPKVDHPRWSQAKERRIGELFKRETLMFNGYDQVSGLYQGMDLKKDY